METGTIKKVAIPSDIQSLVKVKPISGSTDSFGFIDLSLSEWQFPLYIKGSNATNFIRFISASNSSDVFRPMAEYSVKSTAISNYLYYLDLTAYH